MKEQTRSEKLIDKVNEAMSSDIGTKVKKRRKSLNMTIKDVADRTGMSEAEIRRIEGAGSKVKIEELDTLGKALDTDYVGLIFEDYDKKAYDMGVDVKVTMQRESPYLTRKEKRVLKAYRELKKDQKKMIDRALGLAT